eukprot:CAMPEP_0115248296 /NCGR_PEP_ID=MMETSP0270-20121206/41998_1 /TAXON_ID=71861 /ORGANISM="Scrippsiella trochoidea, Strain CCMP3099" /LENGTH=227 /DNA_ID=CAMNT_0002663595 /DNA_START=9 /DNA_END=692 /DNA_ORIENTATION=+
MTAAQRDSRLRRRRPAALVLGGLGLAAAAAAATALSSAAFLPGAASPATALRRREHLLGGFTAAAAAAAALQAPGAALAKAPDALLVTGREGSRKSLNGRWGIVFGKKVNGRDVYKRDGESFYLLYNDCGQFQMATEASGACNGFGLNNKGVWTIDGQEDKLVKVKPADGALPKIEKVDPRELAMKEMGEMKRESEVSTFRGTLTDEDELVGDRLMSKFGATIKKGM